MKIKFIVEPKSGIPVLDSFGNQVVVAMLIDDGDWIVVILDKVKSSMYIEKVINKFAVSVFESSNFMTISDDAFNLYYNYFLENGLSVEKKRTKLSEDEIIATSRSFRR